MSADTRSRLPWQAVLAATVLATLAALAVIVLFGGDDGDDSGPPTDGTLELTPLEEGAAGGGTAGDVLEVEVTTPDGDEAPLDELVEGPTVVNFFASWCSPCIAEMPDFESVFQDVGDDVDFVGLAVNDRTADAARIVEETGISYRWARDPRGDVANAVQITQMPATMFVDADGEVVSVHSGALDAEELRELIASELGGS